MAASVQHPDSITQLREHGERPALTVGDQSLTYGELSQLAGGTARSWGAARRVAVWADTTLESIVAILAAVEAGVELVPVNPKLGEAELRHILTDSAPDLVVGAGSALLPVEIPRIEVDLDVRAELPAPDPAAERVALLIYTSGTTGKPKGVLMPRRAITTNLDAVAAAWEWTAEDRLAHALPLFHVHGLVLGLLGPLRRGGALHHVGRFSPRAIAQALTGGATMVFAVPTMYHRIAQAATSDPAIGPALSRARLLVSGSAALPNRTFQQIEQLSGQQIVERYGLSETIMNTAVRASGARRPGEVGPPVDGVELQLITDSGEQAPPDGQTIGEIVVRGPNLFLGYLNRPEATAEAVRDGWFWTGDLATRSADGYIRIVGRKSTDLIKSGGYKIGAGEIENALLEHPAVSEAAVKGEPDEDLGEVIVAWVVLADGVQAPGQQELADHVAAQLAPHKRPRRVHLVAELPRNAMGKVVKPLLEAPPASR